MSDTRIKPLFPVWPVAAVIPVGKREERRPDTSSEQKPRRKSPDSDQEGKRHIDIYA
jgi:hypothetical protein